MNVVMSRTVMVDVIDGTTQPPIRWRPEGRLTLDRCETCGLLLFDVERVETTDLFDVEDEHGLGGLGAITATHCKEHAP